MSIGLARNVSRAALLLAVGSAGGTLTLSLPAHAQAPEPPEYKPPDDAAALFKQGNDAYRMKRWEEAYQAFWRAFDLKKAYDIAGNLGDVELILGKNRDAAEHLDFSLRNWPAGQQSARKRTTERLAEARAEVGTLNVSVDQSGAEVTVNGKSVGTSPITVPLFVDPGAVTVEAKLGDKTVSRTIAFDKGQEQTLTLELPTTSGGAGKSSVTDAAAATPGAADAATNANANASASTTADTGAAGGPNVKTIGLIASGAVAVVGAGMGVGFLMAKSSAADDVDSLRADVRNSLGPNGCASQPSSADCKDLADANDRAKRNATLSTIGFIGAGVGVAGVVTFLLLPNKQSSTATSVYPLFDQHVMGLGAKGRF